MDFDNRDILKLHAQSAVRVCISFQVVSMDGSSSRMFNRALELVPGEDVQISLYNDLIQ